MQEITERLYKKVMDDFYPVAVDLAIQGHNEDSIVSVFQAQLKIKTQQYYNKEHSPKSIGEILTSVLPSIDEKKADSKAESIFYKMLTNRGLKFEFQYSIGPYKADYLFGGFLVVELDGPEHKKDHDEKRDSYMRRMGYKIIRVPIFVLVSCPDAVIDAIEEALLENSEIKIKKRFKDQAKQLGVK
jgi:very-short-patch-repair endonuclease